MALMTKMYGSYKAGKIVSPGTKLFSLVDYMKLRVGGETKEEQES